MEVPVVDGIAYEVRGHGPGLLLLSWPGYGRRLWSRTADVLAEQFTCLLMDERGCGTSPRRDGPADQAADVAMVLADADMAGLVMVAAGSGGAVTLALAEDRPRLVTAAVLFDPVLREYVDPREPTYLGAVIDDGRARSLRAVGWRAMSPRALGLARHLLPATGSGREVGTSTRRELEEIIRTSLPRARHPQQHRPLYVLDRLPELRATPVMIITTGKEGEPTGGAAAVAEALAGELPVADRTQVSSPWGSLLPFGEPERAAALIGAFAARHSGQA